MKIYNYISRTFIVMAFSMLCSFLATLQLGDSLSPESFGIFNFFKRIFPMCAMMILLGIDKSYIKYFSSNKVERVFKWAAPLIIFNSMLITFLVTYIYNFEGYQFSILICMIVFSFSLFLTSYSRFNNQYAVAQFIQSGHKIIFFIIVLTLIYYYDINSFSIIDIFSVSFSIPFLYIIRYIINESSLESTILFNKFKKIITYGFLFFLVNFLNLLIINMEGLFIPYFYGQEANGVYSGLSFIYITIFNMIGTSIGYVLFPMLSKNENINIKKLGLYALIGIVALLILFIFYGESINSAAFKGKFDSYRSFRLDLMIMFIGALQFINGLLHWCILGIGSIRNIKIYLNVIIFILIAYYFSISYIAISNIGDFSQLLPVVLIAWIFKVSLTIIFIIKIQLFNNYLTNKNAT